jgi:ubiquinone/menaquinone biosynthesis C-methylase UbiE
MLPEEKYRTERIRYWNEYAQQAEHWDRFRKYYRKRLAEIHQSLIPPGMRVLELGCGAGDLLASLSPSYGVGVDFSEAMIRAAEACHPQLHFVQADVHELDLGTKFDYMICSDLVNDLWDVQKVFTVLERHARPQTRLILNTYSRVWEPLRRIAETFGMAKAQPSQNWIATEDLGNMLYLAGFETIRTYQEILWPFGTPLLSGICNRCLVKFAPFRWFAISNIIVVRPTPRPDVNREGVVSVVVPARNEAGNIATILERVPQMGLGTELIFVEGHSRDNTYEVIEREIARRPGRGVKLLRQTGTGKGDAVRLGFAESSGDVLMILDADLTVPPQDLPRFYEAWRSGKGEFINGVRLVYPMEKNAMRFFNLVGNKFFSVMFSWLLGQAVKDTLCGTKVLSRSDYEIIARNRGYFGSLDPFGDFDLIFGAAKYTLKIVDLPVRYRERTYGQTNIQRWSHGWLLLRMLLLAMRRLKFV